MILRGYGTSVQSVDPNFDSKALESGLGPGEVLVVENEQESDHPKTHTHTVAVEGENRLHFRITVRPALRVGGLPQAGRLGVSCGGCVSRCALDASSLRPGPPGMRRRRPEWGRS